MKLIRNFCKKCGKKNFLDRDYNYYFGICNSCLSVEFANEYEYKGTFESCKFKYINGRIIDVSRDEKFLATKDGIYEIEGLEKVFQYSPIEEGCFSKDCKYFMGLNFFGKSPYSKKKEYSKVILLMKKLVWNEVVSFEESNNKTFMRLLDLSEKEYKDPSFKELIKKYGDILEKFNSKVWQKVEYLSKLKIFIRIDWVDPGTSISIFKKEDIKILSLYFEDFIRNISVSNDQKLIAIWGDEKSYIVSTKNWNIIAMLSHSNDVLDSRILTESRSILTGTDNNEIFFWDKIL